MVRLSPALPGSLAWDTPSLNRHPYQLRYGAGLAQQTFRSTPLSSPACQTSQNIPPEPGIPAALVVSTSSAAAAIPTSPKLINWMERSLCPAALRTADSMQVLASEYRHSPEHEIQILGFRVTEGGGQLAGYEQKPDVMLSKRISMPLSVILA